LMLAHPEQKSISHTTQVRLNDPICLLPLLPV
jgi:hypothetical protein